MKNYNINNILVPIDFSETSLNALHTAIEMARRHNAQVKLLYVLEHEEDNNRIQFDYARQMDDLVNKITTQDDLVCTYVIKKGQVAEKIAKVATEFKADLIVIGTHGAKGYNEASVGSNTSKLIDNAGCPMLTVPPLKKWISFKEVLFPIRPTSEAVEKYDYIENIIRKNESILKILGLSNDYEGNISLLRKLAAQLVDRVSIDKVKTSSYFKIGKNMAGEVLKISSLLKTDLIVITSSIDATFHQIFTSSYTRQIMNQAKVPVLCLRSSASLN